MDLWWHEATQDHGNDAGTYTVGKWRGVLHTTEGGSYAGARSAFVAANSWPHFTVSFEHGTFQSWQHIALNRSARSLEHNSGVDTNRAHAIQIEIVGAAATAPGFPHSYLAGIARLMRWIEQQTGIQRTHPRFVAYPQSAGLHNGLRMPDQQWLDFNGWCGHMHVPGNHHGDPGLIDIAALCAGGPTPTPTPAPGIPAWPGRFLRLESPLMQGNDVRMWQVQMNRIGHRLDVDSKYGPACKQACRALQQARHLTVDGVVGAATWTATFARVPAGV